MGLSITGDGDEEETVLVVPDVVMVALVVMVLVAVLVLVVRSRIVGDYQRSLGMDQDRSCRWRISSLWVQSSVTEVYQETEMLV